jgi:four helix bundle protein
VQDFKKLRVWQAAQALAQDVFLACGQREFAKRPGLRSQTIRSADSISTNIAEGAAKNGAEFARYLDISLAAANELEDHLVRARRSDLLGYREAGALIERTDHVRRMLIRLIHRVRGN